MKKSFTCILSLIQLSALAQGGTIQGAVTDAGQKSLPSATIALLRASDSSVVKLSAADKTGRYAFEGIAPGQYLVSATAVGHGKEFSAPVTLTAGNTLSVASLQLLPVNQTMAGVTVVARKPLIEQKADRMVVNVDAAVSNVGATALEVLEKSPGVSVDKDGNISIRGRKGVQVMMDGRPSYLSGAELTSYLKGLPASAIDQIEIMTNPPARYDAAGNSGIINIRSKKIRTQGLNGNLNLSYGQTRYAQYNNSLNLNYRTGKVNVFASLNQNHGYHWQNLDIYRRFSDAGTGATRAIFEQYGRMHNGNDNLGLKLGADYFINKRTTLGIVLSGFANTERFEGGSTAFLKDPSAVTDSIVYGESNTKQRIRNGSLNLNFRRQFDSTGRELTTDIDFVRYVSDNDQRFCNTSYDPQWNKKGAEMLRSDLPVRIEVFSAKADYTHPLSKNAKIEAGAKASFVNTGNGSYYYNTTGVEKIDTGKTNRFDYRERIAAAYVNWNKQAGKWNLQLGLRYEHTSYDGRQFGSPDKSQHPDSSFSRDYGSLFPTAYVSYAASKTHQLSFSYGRRIERPAYQDLNPFLFFLDKYTYQQGNPFLRPQFAHNFEATHSYKGWLNTSINYGFTNDLLLETFEAGTGANSYATVIKNGNIGRSETWGLSVSAQVPVVKWWTAVLYGNYNHSNYSGRLNNGDPVRTQGSMGSVNVNNQLRFGKGWGAELSGFYNTRMLEGQVTVRPMGQVSAGLSKQVLDGKGTLKLNVRDIFWTKQQHGEVLVANTEVRFDQQRDTRAANISFTWRFGKPAKDAAPRRKTGGADAELGRIKGAQ